jgi:SPP1 family predicted phage head-tail adaptor
MPRTADPTISAGDLDRRVTLLQPVYNEFQDEILDWEPVSDVWASVEPGTGGIEVTEGDRTVATNATEITIRYRTDIDARWRVQDREHVYEIKGMSDVVRRRTLLVLNCMEVV